MTFTTLIDADSLARLKAEAAAGTLVILDCRFDLGATEAGRLAYFSAHIPGAVYADLNRDLSGSPSAVSGRHPLPSPAAAAKFFAAAGVTRAGQGAEGPTAATQVIAYDAANGSFAARAWWLLRWLGHTEVAVLDGGLKAWVAAGHPLESVAPTPHATHFDPRPGSAAVIDAPGVLDALRDPRRLLVDARAPERFSGQVEPLDAVAGHVPGAVNHPFALNLGGDGRFLGAVELHRRWRERLGDVDAARAIMMCGSGVTACHNLLALEHAGLPGAALYSGSWSEWIRDAARPVARAAALG